MIPSPYSPGAVPHYLAGRSRELEAIRERLARTKQLGRAGGPLLAFYGPRGLGKTSLLRRAQSDAEESGFLTVWATGRDDVDFAPELARWLSTELRKASFGGRAKSLLGRLDKVALEVGVPGAKLGAEVSAHRHSAVIEESLAAAATLARAHDRNGLAVFVDEFQEARLADRRSLLIALQHFNGAVDGCPVAIIGAGLPSLLTAVPDAATFGERTDFNQVGLLGDVAVAEALRIPAEAVDVTWTDEAILAAIAAARGYPQHVQLLGDGAWAHARPLPGSAILPEHVRHGVESAARRLHTLYMSRLAKLTPTQKNFVSAMAHATPTGTGPVSEEPVSRSSIAAHLGVAPTSGAVGAARQQLLERGLIESPEFGKLQFTLPGFAAWVRENIDPSELSTGND